MGKVTGLAALAHKAKRKVRARRAPALRRATATVAAGTAFYLRHLPIGAQFTLQPGPNRPLHMVLGHIPNNGGACVQVGLQGWATLPSNTLAYLAVA